jgi:hypothetical protein
VCGGGGGDWGRGWIRRLAAEDTGKRVGWGEYEVDMREDCYLISIG